MSQSAPCTRRRPRRSRKLIYTYAERIDAGDFAGVAEVFAHATLTFEGFGDAVSGRDAIAALYGRTTRRYEDGTPRTKHVMTNVIVDVDEDAVAATSRSYFTVLQAVPGEFALQPVIAGRYRHALQQATGAGSSPPCTSSSTWSGTSATTCCST